MQRHVVIMIKEPRPGRVKTRLGRDIGTIPATWWFRHQSARLIRRIGHDRRWTTWLSVSPDIAVASRVWPTSVNRVPQGGGNLGDRMRRVFETVGRGPLLVIGADIPGVTRSVIARAFSDLGANDAVLGPAPDGGYWLVGLQRHARAIPASLFDDVRWSSEFALEDTVASLGRDAKVAITTTQQDVDNARDLSLIELRTT